MDGVSAEDVAIIGRMMATQAELQDRLRGNWDQTVNGKPVSGDVVFMKENILMLLDEAHEVLRCLPWKMHKRDWGREPTAEEWAEARLEITDVLVLLLNLYLRAGVDPRRMVELYFEKAAVNIDRQNTGY